MHWLWTEALAAYTNATASAAYSLYGGGLDILWLATAYHLYGGLLVYPVHLKCSTI